MIDLKDIKTPNPIPNLKREIGSIKKDLAIPKAIQTGIVGSTLGYMFGKELGALAGALGGFFLGKTKELDPEGKQILMKNLQIKQNQLQNAYMAKQVNKKAKGGILNRQDLEHMTFETYPYVGKWKDFFGLPAKPHSCIIYGLPGAGKSTFSFQYADFLSTIGNVLYIAAEEGFGGTLNEKIQRLTKNYFDFSDRKDKEGIIEVLKGKKYDFVFIDSVNYSNLEVEDLEEIKAMFPNTTFITIFQATKHGDFRGSQQYAHNADMIIRIEDGKAINQKNRFAPPGLEFDVFPDAPKQHKKEKNKNQQKLF